MPSGALSMSRRQRTSESEARAPFHSPIGSQGDPFSEDSTPFATYGAGAGSVPGPSTSPRTSPSPSAGCSPETAGLCLQVPSAMASFTKRLTAWMPPREAASTTATATAGGGGGISAYHKRSKSDGAGEGAAGTTMAGTTTTVPPLNISGRAPPASAEGLRRAATPRGTTGITTTTTKSASLAHGGSVSPRVGTAASSTTPRNPPPARSSGLSSAPTVPLRHHPTPPPVITAIPKGGVAEAVAGTTRRQRSLEVHEPFPDTQPAVLSKVRQAGSGGHRLSGGGAAAASAVTTTKTETAVATTHTNSPLTGKSRAFMGSHSCATTRLSSSLRANDHDGPSRSQSSSTPCWVTDTSISTPESLEEERHKLKEAARPPFFSAAPARGEYTPLISWLLRRGEQRDIGLPSATLSISSSSNSTTPRLQHSSFFNEEYVAKLCAAATQVLSAEPGLLQLNVTVKDTLVVVGDIHGQFQDLYTSVLCQQYDRRRCNPGGLDRHFLFMGDYVDRGPHSLEVVLLLLALKVEYPSLIYLTRGNHEEEKTSRVYGFLTEATSSLGAAAGAAVWSAVNKVFLDLPLAAVVTTPHMRFFVTHGGLSPCLHTVDEIAAVNRNRYSAGDITADQDDMVTGLLWSDPTTDVPMYRRNPRGCGFMFGPTASYNFCVENNVDFICRAHQVAMEGYIWAHNERVVTVFSAPNYCGINGNKGAVMVVNGHTRRPILKQYESIEVAVEAPAPRSVFPYSSMFS
jgi:diadenosine tetraphosphatase ApaH/serine/threonine PP2A family protein phosphatase